MAAREVARSRCSSCAAAVRATSVAVAASVACAASSSSCASRRRTGTRSVNVLPTPSADSTVSCPPHTRAKALLTAWTGSAGAGVSWTWSDTHTGRAIDAEGRGRALYRPSPVPPPSMNEPAVPALKQPMASVGDMPRPVSRTAMHRIGHESAPAAGGSRHMCSVTGLPPEYLHAFVCKERATQLHAHRVREKQTERAATHHQVLHDLVRCGPRTRQMRQTGRRRGADSGTANGTAPAPRGAGRPPRAQAAYGRAWLRA
jgi:hypothetical protein